MLQSIPELQSLTMWGLADLLHWAAARELTYGLERSVRFQQNVFEPRRVLVSFSISQIGVHALADVLNLCRTMRAPERHLQSISRFFAGAAYVHFGFEYSGDVIVGKCYLELPTTEENAPATSGRLQFLGFKWSMSESSMAVVTRYRILRVADWKDAATIMQANTGPALQSVMQGLMTAVCMRGQAETCTPSVLEIEEEGSDRKSFDLNVYDLGLSVVALAAPILLAAGVLSLEGAAIENWLAMNSGASVGHIATGLGRDQQSFFTIYYGLS